MVALLLEPSAYDAATRGALLARLSPIAQYAVNLYFRCQMFKEIALPEEGGVLDQNDMVVSMLETVHNNVLRIRADQMEQASRPKTPSLILPGVDTRVTESFSIGNEYKRKVRR